MTIAQNRYEQLLMNPGALLGAARITTNATINSGVRDYRFQADEGGLRCRINAASNSLPVYFPFSAFGIPTTEINALDDVNTTPPVIMPVATAVGVTATLSGCSVGIRRNGSNYQVVHMMPGGAVTGDLLEARMRLYYQYVYGPLEYRAAGLSTRSTVIYVDGEFWYQEGTSDGLQILRVGTII